LNGESPPRIAGTVRAYFEVRQRLKGAAEPLRAEDGDR
jgi:hypothetical protein